MSQVAQRLALVGVFAYRCEGVTGGFGSNGDAR